MKNIAILAVDTSCNSWGKGKTLKEAQTNLKKEGGRLSQAQYRAITFPNNTIEGATEDKSAELYKGIYINDFGDVQIPKGAEYYKI